MKLVLLATAFLAACSGGSKPAPTAPPAGETPPVQSDANHQACAADADCVIVETACCDHCNGGKAEAFNVAFADQHKPTGCEQTACTLMACGAATAKCEAGTCTAVIGSL